MLGKIWKYRIFHTQSNVAKPPTGLFLRIVFLENQGLAQIPVVQTHSERQADLHPGTSCVPSGGHSIFIAWDDREIRAWGGRKLAFLGVYAIQEPLQEWRKIVDGSFRHISTEKTRTFWAVDPFLLQSWKFNRPGVISKTKSQVLLAACALMS